MASDLTFTIHIANVVTAANRLVGWALRTFRRRSRVVMLTIWKSLVQSKLDYTSQLWSPCDQTSISSLESVARNFTAKVEGMDGLDYWDRLKSLHLYSQERRRERYRIIFLWKVAQGLVQGYKATFTNSPRRGRLMQVSPLCNKALASVKRAKEASLQVRSSTSSPGSSGTSQLEAQNFSSQDLMSGWPQSLTSLQSLEGQELQQATPCLIKFLLYRHVQFYIRLFI